MKGLIDIFQINGIGSYPDHYSKFGPRTEVEYQGKLYWLCEYTGDLPLIVVSEEDYLTYKEQSSFMPVIPLGNVQITGATLVSTLWWNSLGTPVGISGEASMPDGQFICMLERVIDGEPTDLGGVRTILDITNGVISLNFTFPECGNFIIRESRVNKGLENIGAPFRVSLEKDIEFDVHL